MAKPPSGTGGRGAGPGGRSGGPPRNDRSPGERTGGERTGGDRPGGDRSKAPPRGGPRGDARPDQRGARKPYAARGERTPDGEVRAPWSADTTRSTAKPAPYKATASKGDGPRSAPRPARDSARPERTARPAYGDRPARPIREDMILRDERRPARFGAPTRGKPRDEASADARPLGRSDREGGRHDGGRRGRGRPEREATGDAPRGGFRPGGTSQRSTRPAPDKREAPAKRVAPVAPSAELFAGGTPHAISENGERIAKLLARAGIASRREVERLIEAGRVKLNDVVIETPATVLTSLRGITVDDQPVRAPDAARLWAFHKPPGLLTAERDPAGRPTIYTALRNALPEGTPRLMPIGRLDLNTEGLLLLTNDGELKRAMELPSSLVPRTYRARTFGDVNQNQLEALMEGITIEGINYGSINANMERSTGRNQWIELMLTEGKNREVRRVLEHLGLQVSRLIRVSYGPFLLDDLPRGAAVPIRQHDVENFRKSLKPKSQ